jgi:hypothetical protein
MAAGDVRKKIRGVVNTIFQIGIGGLNLKFSGGKLRLRNAADSADAEFVASQLSASGDDIVLNEDAAGSGAGRTFTLRRPSSGMSEARVIVLPSGNPAVGQALQVASYASGVVTLDYLTVAAGNDKVITDTTSLAFGDTSPKTMFTLPANAVVHLVKVIVDTAFNGTAPTLSIGVSGTTSKYMAATENDLKTTGVYEVDPGLTADGTTNAIIATYSADSSSAGAARIEVSYSIPS